MLVYFFDQIVFEGIKGASGFIALDDIEYTVGIDCDDRLVDPKPGEICGEGGWFNTHTHKLKQP